MTSQTHWLVYGDELVSHSYPAGTWSRCSQYYLVPEAPAGYRPETIDTPRCGFCGVLELREIRATAVGEPQATFA
jgi:hypothetical protein